MQIKTITAGATTIIEIISHKILIKTPQDALDLMASASSDHIILHDYNFEPDFFDLSTRKLGEILQKFTNYHVKLAVIGNFKNYPSKTLQQFIYESNRGGEYLFLDSVDAVTKTWTA